MSYAITLKTDNNVIFLNSPVRFPVTQESETGAAEKQENDSMKTEDLQIHIRSIRSLAARVEVYGDPKESTKLREFASRLERDLQGRAQRNIIHVGNSSVARNAAQGWKRGRGMTMAGGGGSGSSISSDLGFGDD